MYVKKDGVTPLDWIAEANNMRERLNLAPGDRPWTSRAKMQLRGLPKQSEEYNTLDENLNLTWARWRNRQDLNPWTAEPPSNGVFFCDVYQSCKRQLASDTDLWCTPTRRTVSWSHART